MDLFEPITITLEPNSAMGKHSPYRNVLCMGEVLVTSDEPVLAAARVIYNRGVPAETGLIIEAAFQAKRHTTVGDAAELNSTRWDLAKPDPAPFRPFLVKLLKRPKRGGGATTPHNPPPTRLQAPNTAKETAS